MSLTTLLYSVSVQLMLLDVASVCTCMSQGVGDGGSGFDEGQSMNEVHGIAYCSPRESRGRGLDEGQLMSAAQ